MTVIFQSIVWSIVGVIVCRQKIFSIDISGPLAKTLYWVGVPLQIFFLARNSDFGQATWLPAVVAVLVLLLGLGFTLLIIGSARQLFGVKAYQPISTINDLSDILAEISSAPISANTAKAIIPTDSRGKGSYILGSILGNTGFVGLALVPSLVERNYWSWVVLYGVAHNILGSYGLGAVIAEHFSLNDLENNWLDRLQNLVLLPSLWGFACGYFCRNLTLPPAIELIVSKTVLLVVPGAFILMGMRLSKLRQWHNLRSGIFPALCKVLVIPLVTGLVLTLIGFRGDSRLVLVLMSGMPTAFATIILSEAYELDRNIAASSVLLSTLAMPIFLFLWLNLF